MSDINRTAREFIPIETEDRTELLSVLHKKLEKDAVWKIFIVANEDRDLAQEIVDELKEYFCKPENQPLLKQFVNSERLRSLICRRTYGNIVRKKHPHISFVEDGDRPEHIQSIDGEISKEELERFLGRLDNEIPIKTRGRTRHLTNRQVIDALLEGKTLKEIAHENNLTPTRITQITKGIEKTYRSEFGNILDRLLPGRIATLRIVDHVRENGVLERERLQRAMNQIEQKNYEYQTAHERAAVAVALYYLSEITKEERDTRIRKEKLGANERTFRLLNHLLERKAGVPINFLVLRNLR